MAADSVSSILARREIEKRPAQSVHLVDDDTIDPVGIDILQQLLQSRTVKIPAGEASVVIMFRDQGPAGMLLAFDECLAGLALRVERVELLIETLLGRFASVNYATNRGRRVRRCAAPQARKKSNHSSGCR